MAILNVLVACEESQRTCSEFRKLGHNAFSCDLQKTSGFHPEWHINSTVIPLLSNTRHSFVCQDGSSHTVSHWDLLIAHPPCTYLTRAGSCHLYKGGVFNEERYKDGILAASFFLTFLNCDIPFICVENPVPDSRWNLPRYSQIVQPYYFGDPYTKATCLWLKNLPYLIPTALIHPSFCEKFMSWGSKGSTHKRSDGLNSRAVIRSRTFPGFAVAMASQFSRYVSQRIL